MKKNLLCTLIIATLSSQMLHANNYSTSNSFTKYYQVNQNAPPKKNQIAYLEPNQQPTIYETDSPKDINQFLLENRFFILGCSSFTDRKLPLTLVKQQAERVKAISAFVYKRNISENSYDRDDDLSNLDYAYEYQACFYAKDLSSMQPNMFGMIMTEIPYGLRQIYQRNTGTYVDMVMKNSVAYNSNILQGDVIIALNGINTPDPRTFLNVKAELLKTTKSFNIKIVRIVNNQTKEIIFPITIN